MSVSFAPRASPSIALKAVFILIALVVTAPTAAAAATPNPNPTTPLKKQKLRVGMLDGDYFPFVNDSATEGFEPALVEQLCSILQAECTKVLVTNIDARFTVVDDGRADFSIGLITVTPERALVVDFVQPYYYSSGAVLFTNNTIDLSAGWDGITGETVCIESGYYGQDYVENTLGLKVVNFASDSTDAEIDALVQNGTCIGIVDDSSLVTVAGYPEAGLSPVDSSPYGVAVKKGNTQMRHQLSAALVDLMSQGNTSEILRLQQEYLVAKGLIENPEMEVVVNSISTFDTATDSGDGSGSGSGSDSGVPAPAPASSATITTTTTVPALSFFITIALVFSP